MYWSIPIAGTEQVLQIPRSQEWGGFFGTVPEALFDSLYRQDPQRFMEMFGAFFESLTPPLGYTTTIRNGRLGQACARPRDGCPKAVSAAADAHMARRRPGRTTTVVAHSARRAGVQRGS
jgi:hypothetical protein